MSMPESDEMRGESRQTDGFVPELIPAEQPPAANPAHPVGEQPHGPHNVEEARKKVLEAIDRNVADAQSQRHHEAESGPDNIAQAS